MSLTPLSPLPPLLEKYIFFALPSMNGPLPAELKFRENIEKAYLIAKMSAPAMVRLASFDFWKVS